MRVYKPIKKILKEDKRKNICVDFDGVIHKMEYFNPQKFFTIIEGTREALIQLRKKYRIVIFTSRAIDNASKGYVIGFLRHNEIPFDEITSTKISADYYIDDRAIRFTNWEEVLKKVEL